MDKVCFKCKKPGVEKINIEGKEYYSCNYCKSISPRFSDEKAIFSETSKKGIVQHAVAVTILEKDKKILLIKRRVWPFCYALPGGHIENGETPLEAQKREMIEELGIIPEKPKLVLHTILENDLCRHGAAWHEWFLYKCDMDKNRSIFVNSEAESADWFSLEEAMRLNLSSATKTVLTEVYTQKRHVDCPEKLKRFGTKNQNLAFDEEKMSELIFHISNAFLSLRNTNQVLEIATNETLKAINSASVSIAILKEDYKTLEIKAYARNDKLNNQPDFPEFKIGQGVAGQAAQTKKIISISDVKNNSIFIKGKSGRTKSLLCIPMIVNGKLIGVIDVADTVVRNWTEEEVRFLSILASQLGIALENSRLFAESEKEKDLLDSVVKNIQEGVVVVDLKGRVIVWNKYAEEITGLKSEEANNQSGIKLAKKLGFNDLIGIISEALLNRDRLKDFYLEKRILTVSGQQIWIGINMSFIGDQGNGNYILTFRNISRDRELLQAKNDLVSTATHELRTPLTAVKGYLSMLRNGDAGEFNKKQEKYLGHAYQSTERLVGLVESLLKTLKIDENKVQLNLQNFDIVKIAADSIENLKHKAKGKNISIHLKSGKLFAFGDPDNTKHIIENIVDNAIKYTKNNGKIDVTLKNNGDNILVSIKDTGIGIPQGAKERIFDRFIRVNNPLSVKAGGTGLGLHIAKNMVQKQGGKIWLESKLNVGTTFYFTVPASINITNN
ncbi:MAG: ATP-binding protein [Patescibacteria group bacterium]